jgi:hypothetical protein
MNTHRIVLSLGAATSGLLAAAFLPMAVAYADDYSYGPDLSTFDPTAGPMGIPPDDVVSGTEKWFTYDLTTSTMTDDSLSGGVTVTNLGNITISDFLVGSNIDDPSGLAAGSVIDQLAGGGYLNVFVDAAAGSLMPGITDYLQTPFGDFTF